MRQLDSSIGNVTLYQIYRIDSTRSEPHHRRRNYYREYTSEAVSHLLGSRTARRDGKGATWFANRIGRLPVYVATNKINLG